MIRVRFYANLDDPRPINWPIKHPYWVSGETEDYAIVVAYADSEEYILTNWPEARELDVMEENVNKYTFTDRFSKPEWFKVTEDEDA